MSEPQNEPAALTAEGEGTPTVAELDRKVDRLAEMISQLLGGGGHDAPQAAEAAPEAEPVDVGAEVRKEMDRLHAKEEARKKKEAEDDANLTNKIRQVVEKPPREFKRATEAMGWVGPNDR